MTPASQESISDVRRIEIKLFLDGIFQKYGYDFRDYATTSMSRRIDNLMLRFGFSEPLVFLQKLIRDSDFFLQALPYFTIGTTEMFRDPEFFRRLRQEVLPHLKTYPLINIWVAGTSTGEELYSLAILLHEENMLSRSVIFGTDINPLSLKAAQEGIYSKERLSHYEKNYRESGGTGRLQDYFTQAFDHMKITSSLQTNMVFSEHNLAADSIFSECQLILCRNVLIYFNRELQNRVLNLFVSSLQHRGYLCLGSKESVRFSDASNSLETLDERWRIYRKSGPSAASIPKGTL